MKLIPWSHVKHWRCVRCGNCCKHTTVQLTTPEWLKISRLYGFEIVDQRLGGFYLRKTLEDQCPFLYKSLTGVACGLQHIKPLACKLWPFRIRSDPRFGHEAEAIFKYGSHEFYVYTYPQCPGITFGKPSPAFKYKVLPEFLNIRLGLQKRQQYSTSKLK